MVMRLPERDQLSVTRQKMLADHLRRLRRPHRRRTDLRPRQGHDRRDFDIERRPAWRAPW
jgi:hypothetical protein